MDDTSAAPAKATGDYLAALTLIMTDLASVVYALAPAALEERLREVRLEVQALESGRLAYPGEDDFDARRRRLALLERCIDEARSGQRAGPTGISPV